MLFVDFAFDQKLDTFLRLHREALQYFGGTPRRVAYDNLKSVVLHHIGRMVQFNPNFLPFAGHYLFEPAAGAGPLSSIQGSCRIYHLINACVKGSELLVFRRDFCFIAQGQVFESESK